MIGIFPANVQSSAACAFVVSLRLESVNSFTFHSHPAIVSQSYPVAVLVKTCPVVPAFSGSKFHSQLLSSAHLYPVLVLFNTCPRLHWLLGLNGKSLEITLLVMSIQSHAVRLSCLPFQ